MKYFLLLVVLASCGGKTPATRFYQLAHTSKANGPQGELSIAVDTLATEAAYDDERIVYRVNPYRLDYYNYHRWSSPPGTLVGNFLEQAFENSGRFASVLRDGSSAPLTLRGRVIAIEEVDRSKTQWVGRVVIELTLVDTVSNEVLWTEQFEEHEPLPAQSPEGLAQSLSQALGRIADRAIVKIVDRAAQHARKATKTTPARSAVR